MAFDALFTTTFNLLVAIVTFPPASLTVKLLPCFQELFTTKD